MRVDLDTLRLACGESLEQNKKWRDEFIEQNVCILPFTLQEFQC